METREGFKQIFFIERFLRKIRFSFPAHACPELSVNLKKCPRTNKRIPILTKAVETREGGSDFFHRALIEKTKTFQFSAQRAVVRDVARGRGGEDALLGFRVPADRRPARAQKSARHRSHEICAEATTTKKKHVRAVGAPLTIWAQSRN